MAHAFRQAVEAQDADAAIALLAPDVTFRSPVVYRPYEGAETVAVLLRAVFEVFEDFRYVSEIGAPDADEHVLVFEANVGDRQVTGVDILRTDADGKITDFMVMVRPMSGMHALAAAMQAKLS
jgi:hypothetical protein